MLELTKIILISKFHQLHAKISTPTGATAPVEKVKEISSDDNYCSFQMARATGSSCKMQLNGVRRAMHGS